MSSLAWVMLAVNVLVYVGGIILCVSRRRPTPTDDNIPPIPAPGGQT